MVGVVIQFFAVILGTIKNNSSFCDILSKIDRDQYGIHLSSIEIVVTQLYRDLKLLQKRNLLVRKWYFCKGLNCCSLQFCVTIILRICDTVHLISWNSVWFIVNSKHPNYRSTVSFSQLYIVVVYLGTLPWYISIVNKKGLSLMLWTSQTLELTFLVPITLEVNEKRKTWRQKINMKAWILRDCYSVLYHNTSAETIHTLCLATF